MLLHLSRRDQAVLAAVAAHRCMLAWGAEPDLLVDGYWFCDQPRAHYLIAAGMLGPAACVEPGQRVLAELTESGRAVLEELAVIT